jgi:hypothetical protein
MKRQLEIQADGLSGNLDKIWPDIRNSAWIGGNADGWERVPYWLDGFIPLAYLLNNEDMIQRAKNYIDSILNFQKPDGWICPCPDDKRAEYDPWAIILISKTLSVYYDCSGDERIPFALYRVLKNFYSLLKNGSIHLFNWGKCRWFEAFIPMISLYDKYPEKWLKDLGRILIRQGLDYQKLTDEWKTPLNKWTYTTHIVNLAMMLKYEALVSDFLGYKYTDKAQKLYNVLKKYNGTPTETFTGDECLSGLSPIQGTELCAVVEQMYSYELLYAFTGDKKWAERLEVIAFNALPATLSDDMWAHQYVQMSNQIACQKFPGKPLFRTNGSESHLFGLEPNFGCCTANFNQGYPKLALFSFLHDESTIESSLMLPCILETDEVRIELISDYPFKNTMRYIIDSKKDFTFKIRIPSFAKNLKVNGILTNTSDLLFNVEKGSCQICIEFDAIPYFESRPHNLSCVRYGSVVFSIPISYEKKMLEYERGGVIRKYPYCDYEYVPTSEWEYAYSDTKICVESKDVTDIPFSSVEPPLILKAKVKRIRWGYEDGYDTVCRKTPKSRTPVSDEIEIDLFPYGCAKLRMTEIPLLKSK